MAVLLMETYVGLKTHGHEIPPGVYHKDDKRLFGLGAYLVQNGFARAVDDRAARGLPMLDEEDEPVTEDQTGEEVEVIGTAAERPLTAKEKKQLEKEAKAKASGS
jgi:hypothetical protein